MTEVSTFTGVCDVAVDDYVTIGDRGLYLVVETFADRVTLVKVPWYTRLWMFIKGLRP